MNKKNTNKLKKSSATGSNKATVQKNKQIPTYVTNKKDLVGSKLSDCTADYLRCLVNPHTGPLACVPSTPIIKSLKVRNWVYGECRTGTAGIGFILVDPTGGVTNDSAATAATGATFAGTTIALPPTTGVFYDFSNSNFATASFANTAAGASYRIVGASVRIRYIGTELNRGGTCVCFQDPTHTSLVGRDIASLLGEVDCVKIPIKHEWISVNWRPTLIGEYGFATTINAAVDFGPMVIMIEAPYAGTASAFEYQFSGVYEINGRNVRGQTTTHIDPVGSAAAQYVTQTSPHMLPSAGNAQNKESGVLMEALSYIDRAVSFVGTTAKTIEHAGATAKNIYNTAQPLLRLAGAL
jgi:hypothetical protein